MREKNALEFRKYTLAFLGVKGVERETDRQTETKKRIKQRP